MIFRRVVWIVVAIIAAWLALSALAFWQFNSGDSVPESGEGT
jgi:hypothetical protein